MGLFSKKSSKANSVASDGSSKSGRKGVYSMNGSTKSLNTQSRISGCPSPGLPPIPQVDLPPAPDPHQDPSAYLRSIYAVRERSRFVVEAAQKNQLTNFTVDMSKFPDVAEYVVSIIKRDFAPDYHTIPPHGRWQHFDVGGTPRVDNLLKCWPEDVDQKERTRRLIDLFLVSVLLDAGAGNKWQYKASNGRIYRRSEGLAVASLEMFTGGLFSSNPSQRHQVDGAGLKNLTIASLSKGLQVTPENPLEGLEGRCSLLMNLGIAMDNSTYFGASPGRPGNMLDFLLDHPVTSKLGSTPVVAIPTLWDLLMDGLAPIWPQSRTQFNGVSLGDAWQCSSMPPAPGWERIVPFHKLTQWLCYSLLVPMTKLMGIMFVGQELLTGLPEYRNGGLFIDTGLITLKTPQQERGIKKFHENAEKNGVTGVEVVPAFTPDDDVIVEWRAVTLGFLDMLLEDVNKLLGLSGPDTLSLAQMLEAGTWKGGRELAEVSRPNTKGPPIMILSDGTVF